ncbi:hypothetical protein PO883_28770 [Massilia sp. DJPM01]|uniref:hypothetical protein n=1 Tax=Massilia sp. DJPM01 TaxID=3024404 RepID=UPI00259F44DF|nr:hypothetical protein [Massilia sp. DJPM01]MDM5181180.1 hypothetical protein [Massilia sp. DJPM01]
MNDRAGFLAGSIVDMQATIRAIDVKVAGLLVVLLIPLQNLHRVFKHLKHFCNVTPSWPAMVVACLFLLVWFLAFYSLVRAVAAVGNPVNHINNPTGLNGSFFLGGLYKLNFIDAFFTRRKVKSRHDPMYVKSRLPVAATDVEAELVFEQMKLAYIRDIKLHRLYWGLMLSLVWLLLGIAIFIASKFAIS